MILHIIIHLLGLTLNWYIENVSRASSVTNLRMLNEWFKYITDNSKKNLVVDCYNVDASESKILAASFMLYLKMTNEHVNIMSFC